MPTEPALLNAEVIVYLFTAVFKYIIHYLYCDQQSVIV